MAKEVKENQPAVDSQQSENDQQQTQDDLPENKVEVTDAGTLKKKVTVTISRRRIDAKLGEMFGELADTVQVPGFRIGHAPRRLVEKRFGKEVSQDVRNALVGESIGQAIEKTALKTIGEPDLDLESIELPESGDMEFSFTTEVAPEFDLPKLKGIEVTRPVAEVTDERIDQQLRQWAQSQARYERTDGGAAEDDMVTAGAKISVEGVERPIESPGLTLRVAPGQIEGLPLVDLGKALAGKKAGESAELAVTVSDAHPNEQWRGKQAKIEIQISEVRRRIVPKIDDELAGAAGFGSLKELQDYIRGRIESRLSAEINRAMQRQVEQYLLDNTDFDLPAGMLGRHTDRLVQRRFVNLLQEGVPREQIDRELTELQAAAAEQARRDLKLRFILEKVAEEKQVEVTPDELNSRVAEIAGLYNRRPERVRQELAADGSLEQLRIVLREEKAVAALLAEAKISDATVEQKQRKPRAEAKKKTAKKATKKTAKKSTRPKKA